MMWLISSSDITIRNTFFSYFQDVNGSKASLIGKGTPCKKKVKKKVKKSPGLGESTEFFDNALAEDLKVIQDDIVASEKSKKEEKDYAQQPYSVASNIPRSQPTEKFYIETDSELKFCYSYSFK